MAALRTAQQVNDYVDKCLSWRKKELTTLKFLIEKATPPTQDVLLRGGVALLYAHWEGFVKEVSEAYVDYISRLGLNYCQLRPNFVALAMRGRISECGGTRKTSIHLKLVDFFLTEYNGRAQFPREGGINTESNLRSNVLKEIMVTLGLDFSLYETEATYIDTHLVDARNSIAHGEPMAPTQKEYKELHQKVIGFIETYRNQIENATVTGLHLAKPTPPSGDTPNCPASP